MSIECSSSSNLSFSEQSDINSLINRIFWCSLFFGILFYYIDKFIKVFLKKSKLPQYKWRQTVRHVWHINYFAASSIFLYFYHKYFIASEVEKEIGRYYPKYENTLFFTPNDNYTKYKDVFIVIISFHLIAILMDLKQCDFSEAATRFLYSCILVIFYSLRYEHYSVMFNISLGIFQFVTEILSLLSLHTSSKSNALFRLYALCRFLSWSYVFLNLLPFKYLLPTLYSKNFNVWLNIFCWLWYGSCVWNSPILQYIYHQTFHLIVTECIGGGNVAKCIMLKDTQETKHYKILQKALLDLKLSNEKANLSTTQGAGNASARTFQTIKCILALKRKLRRIRENRESSELSSTSSSLLTPTTQSDVLTSA